MARHRRKSSHRKNPRRVRSAKRAYKKSGLYKYNLRRKRKGHGKRRKKYGKRKHRARHGRKRRHGGRRRRHGAHKRRHHARRKHYKRLSKAEAHAARIQRKLARSKRHVAVLPKSELTSHQKSYLEKLRERKAGLKAAETMPWAS